MIEKTKPENITPNRGGGSHPAWRLRPAPPSGLSARFRGIPPLWAHLAYSRGIRDPEELHRFTSPGAQPLHDPSLLPDMDTAVSRFRQAMERHETVAIFGDFDTDGVSATALLAEALSALGIAVLPYIPHRVDEGHGLNIQAMAELRAQGASLLVTVDCGVTSHQEVRWGADHGLDVIITDHHAPPPSLPPAVAIVDTGRPDSRYPFPHLTGVGMAFKLAQALYQRLGQSWPEALLELVALGTVTDLAPLTDENRTLLWRGLRHLNTAPRPGLQALTAQTNLIPGAIEAEDIAFYLGPRLNAAGRLEDASLSYNLLVTQDLQEATALAQQLERYNAQRRQLTNDVMEAVRRSLDDQAGAPLLLVAGHGYHPGVLGLVASRLVEERYRPAIVVSQGADGTSRGSGRSIPEFNLIQALRRCGDLFIRLGGHPQAAGFDIPTTSLDQLRIRLLAIANEELQGVALFPHLEIDAQVPLGAINSNAYAFLRSLAPFGAGNPAPVFLSRAVPVIDTRVMGADGEHLRLILKGNAAEWNAVAFGQAAKWLPGARRIDVVYTVGEDAWNGQGALRLRVLDFVPRP